MISVILPVYNAELYLNKTIDSILNQTISDFELICIDDGSTDSSLKILYGYANVDNRIRIISRDNRGLIYTLNEGIRESKYNIIARIDADDVCEPKRFEIQLSYLNSNPDVAVVGTSYNYIDENGNLIGKRILSDKYIINDAIKVFGSPFCHPSVMINKKLVGEDLYYDKDYIHAEDYELWLRLSKKYKLINLKDILLNYRILSSSISRKNEYQQKLSMVRALEYHVLNNKVLDKDNLINYYLYNKNRCYFMRNVIFNKKIKLDTIIQLMYFVLKVLKNVK
ncbi:glycosyltransferase [Photobacterium damselae subsp. damselae]|uniref:Glycosyltransferase n=1 Tax=Photobacterium damselae subsp. damselae TaxID=85581 RepID=A0A850QH97_PHODD|nr:glycosyltransferase [Photobacterium damselae subsp. damselae]